MGKQKYKDLVWGGDSVWTEVDIVISGDGLYHSSGAVSNGSSGAIGFELDGRKVSGNYRCHSVVRIEPGSYKLRFENKRQLHQFEGIDAYILVYYYEPKV